MKLAYFTASYLVKAEKEWKCERVREQEVCYIADTVLNNMSETRWLPALPKVDYNQSTGSLT